MSHLWPERPTLGLFPKHAWLRAGRRLEHMEALEADDKDWMRTALERALLRARELGAKGGGIDIVLSDRLARCSLMPWQERQLDRPQLDAYARACLDRAGADVSDGWTVDAGFRHFRSPGLAVAVPSTVLSDLVSIASAHRMRLSSAVPMTALAYWQHSPGFRSQHSTLFLYEAGRLTLMQWGQRRLAAMDVQPVADQPGVALRRMLLRYPSMSLTHVHVWNAHAESGLSNAFAEQCPETLVHISGPMQAGAR